MIDRISVGLNIKSVREEQGKTQREVSEAADISPSQLSAYENGKQLPGLETLANIALALETSLDRLYFGAPSEQFLNRSGDFGETVVNCFLKLDELDLYKFIIKESNSNAATVHIRSCGEQIDRLFKQLREYESRKSFYPDGESYVAQVCKSVANEINEKKADGTL